ncbi:phage holin family protein [Caldicoprobacter algeriensis]|uniref:phage holin family protein n=1 Tax=Caldicoprobacter algeriensis TaxID=699281 RepID=UPI00207A412E|nr:phage holin family protein [Caldicoprobacter algeriensis]
MKSIINSIQVALTAVGGFLGWLLGGLDGLLYALIAFVVADYLTGLAAARVEQKVSSKVGFIGIMRKILIFLLVGLGNIIDVYLLGNGSAIRTAIIFFYVSNEGISILENCARAGLPVPDKLKVVLEQFSKTEKTEGQ